MSKDREGREEENLDPTAGADEVVDLGKSADSGLSAAAAGVSDADITDPESEAPDAYEIEAEIEAAEDFDSEAIVVDNADGEADDSDSELAEAEVAAVGAGSNRAALRKAGARSGVTEKKGAPTRARDESTEKSSVFARLARFIREVVAELRKVIWPSQKQMITYTIVVITFLIFMIALVAGLDVLFHFGIGSIFG